jgi:maltose O-acetyltransferase
MNFYRILEIIFKLFCYRSFRRKYNLPASFRFNGIFIRIYGKGKILIGKNSYVSHFSYINLAEKTTLTIGSHVSIGHNVKIYTSGFDTKGFIQFQDKLPRNADVTIGDNVLIGSNVFITPGVVIHSNVVVGANSVVTGELETGCVYAGVPAKKIKSYSPIL